MIFSILLNIYSSQKKKLFIPRVVEELTPFVRAPYTDAHRESKQKAELTYIYS
jgi:hypothetical protein